MAGAWQDVVVAAAAASALAWLIRRRLKKKRGCADCALAEAMTRGPAKPVPGARAPERPAR